MHFRKPHISLSRALSREKLSTFLGVEMEHQTFGGCTVIVVRAQQVLENPVR